MYFVQFCCTILWSIATSKNRCYEDGTQHCSACTMDYKAAQGQIRTEGSCQLESAGHDQKDHGHEVRAASAIRGLSIGADKRWNTDPVHLVGPSAISLVLESLSPGIPAQFVLHGSMKRFMSFWASVSIFLVYFATHFGTTFALKCTTSRYT